jgi:hypothetical protein
MFEGLDKQRIADYFNEAIGAVKRANMTDRGTEAHADERRAAIYALQRFEGATFWPEALNMAVAELPAGSITFSPGSGIQADINDMREVLERYIEIIEEKTGAPAIEDEIFTSRSAAWYVARQLTRRGTPMTFAGIDKHIRVNKDLRGKMVGTSMIFPRKQLDDYVENFHKLPKRGDNRKALTEIKS